MNAYKPIITLVLCCLGACTSLKKPMDMPITPQHSTIMPTESLDTTPINAKHQGQASTISSWNLSGAIAARNKNKSWTASINWRQEGVNRYQIRLFGPLGGGTVIIEKQGAVITYRDGPKKITSTDADKLLLTQTGVRLPVNSLYYWIRGIAAPGPVGSEQHEGGKALSQLKQGGYTVTYSQYTVVNGTTLPAKIRLEGHGVMIKMVIKHWSI